MEQNTRILHIENDPHWREIISRRLGKQVKIKLEQAGTINAAKNLLLNNDYDLILADLDMSGQGDIAAGLDDFSRLMLDLGIEKGSRKLDERPAIVVLTGRRARVDDIRKTINKYPGWIWGWFEKNEPNSNGFEKLEISIEELIGTLERQRLRSKSMVYSNVWPGGVVQLLAYIMGAIVIWLAYQYTSNIALAIFISVIPLSLMIATQAYYLRMYKQLSDESYQTVVIEILRQIFRQR